ncbi:MAG: FAD-binding protein [Thermoflexales bacterium]|nr:FAD-binding protein [Thermoflexales bacterium]MDW8373926.1 FAD-binding protein [Planctomycetota bacterium]
MTTIEPPGYNWAGNLRYRALRLHRPATPDELRAIVAQSRKVHALGSRHSFNDVADCEADLVSLERMPHALTIDRERRTVTVSAGITYAQLCPELHRAGFALSNLASLPHISVAGAIATATHGSGDGNGNLATAVAAIELVTAEGDRVTLSRERDGERFNGAVIALGALGVVTRVTLDLLPAFEVRQRVYRRLPMAQIEAHFDAIMGSAYSVSLFTNWQTDFVDQVWLKQRVGDPAPDAADEFFGAAPATQPQHPIEALSAEPCTTQMGIAGPWHERLPHFRPDCVPSAGDELQSEYFVPRRFAVEAMRAVAALRDHLAPALLISEVRTVAADRLWLSPCYDCACVGLHFTWKKDWPAVRRVLALVEAALAPFEPRPHWGKLFTLPPAQVQARYPRLADFRALARELDAQGKFHNAFTRRYLFDAAD